MSCLQRMIYKTLIKAVENMKRSQILNPKDTKLEQLALLRSSTSDWTIELNNICTISDTKNHLIVFDKA